jgi:hypothetical protein
MTEAGLRQLEEDGFLLLPAVFPAARVETILAELTATLEDPGALAALRAQGGSIYAARNVLTLWPPAADVWRQPPLPEALALVLGARYGLVRALFFDKPPRESWALPWHKDLTVAVRDNRLRGTHFARPTTKAGVPHVEAPREVLEEMLTARIHLDEVTDDNGPLRVLPGSHRHGKALGAAGGSPRSILAGRGDVLLMRPLLAHGSGHSHPETTRHRRVLHLEFAARAELPDGYAWHTFLPGRPAPL